MTRPQDSSPAPTPEQADTPPPPTINHNNQGGWAVEIAGSLHWPHAARLTQTLQLTNPGPHAKLELNLVGVTSLDTTAIAVIANAAARLGGNGTELRLIATPDQRRRLPRTAGLQDLGRRQECCHQPQTRSLDAGRAGAVAFEDWVGRGPGDSKQLGQFGDVVIASGVQLHKVGLLAAG